MSTDQKHSARQQQRAGKSRLLGKGLLLLALLLSLTNVTQAQIIMNPDVDSICVNFPLNLTYNPNPDPWNPGSIWQVTGGGTITPNNTSQSIVATWSSAGAKTIRARIRRFPTPPGGWVASYQESIVVVDQPVGPTLDPVTSTGDVCEGEDVVAYIIPGTGGVSCYDELQYSTRTGVTWSSPLTYTSGQPISTTGVEEVLVEGRRTGCDSSVGCSGTGWAELVRWNVIVDVIAPVPDVDPLADVTAECEVTSLTAPTATDNCVGSVTGTHNATLPITSTTVITWTYTDGTNTSTQTQNVVINDITAPVPDLSPLSDVTAECSVTSLSAPTATDNCSGTVTGTHNATLPITTQGTTVVTWTYTDNALNTSTQTQNVIIDDATPPTITCAVPAASYAMDAGSCDYTVPDNSLDPTSSGDNCGVVTLTNDYNGLASLNGAVFPEGTTTVIWTADDGNGNTTTCQYDVVVDGDSEPPSISGCPTDITVTADTSYCGIEVTWTPPTATDNCSVVLTSTHNPGDFFPVGTTTVTYTATDGEGLTDLCSFDVIVDAYPQPTISGPLSVCNPSTETYTVTDPGSHTFLWTVTNGTIVGSDTNSSVDVLWSAAGQGTVTVVITSGSGCTSSNNVTVDVSTASDTGEINSSTSLTRR